MARQKKIVIDVVTTTKIQAIVDGKKRTIRMWRLPLHIPSLFANHIKTYIKDAKNEALCESRSSEEWIEFIKSFSMSTPLRAWVTSVIWWHFGGGNDDILYDYYKSFKHIKLPKDKKKLFNELERMGISKVANGVAADREKERNSKLKKIIDYYLRGG